MNLSIVIPLLNESESLPELEAWIRRVMDENSFSYEVLLIDDGSTDNSWEIIRQLSAANPNVRGVKFRRNYGKSAGLNEGFVQAKGDVIITMDADLQDSPGEIPELYRMITQDGFDMVSGWKKKRHDPIGKTLPSKLYNAVTSSVSGIKLHDFNCGLKAYKKEVVKNIEVYGEMHRYIPVIARWAGFKKIGEKVVEHHARKYGVSKFGWERFVTGFLDLTSIMFVGKFGKKPMHFFGTMGLVCFIIGFGMLFYLSFLKIVDDIKGIADRPIFFLGIVLLLLGSQLFLTGFLAEMLSRNSPQRNNYQIEENIG